MGLQHVLKKYRRAKALLQAHLHETQRLKAVAAGEAQKAAAAAEQARALEAQLAASTAVVADATVAQQRLQQQVRGFGYTAAQGISLTLSRAQQLMKKLPLLHCAWYSCTMHVNVCTSKLTSMA
jgi:hypothetical protein